MPCCVIRAYKLGTTTSMYCVIYIAIPMTCYSITYVNLVSCVVEKVIVINNLFIPTCSECNATLSDELRRIQIAVEAILNHLISNTQNTSITNTII